jgi:hypothetical protein
MSNAISGVKVHDDLVLRAENTRQSSTAAATTQAAVVSIDVSFHRAVVASALKNGISPAASMLALKHLGVTGQ